MSDLDVHFWSNDVCLLTFLAVLPNMPAIQAFQVLSEYLQLLDSISELSVIQDMSRGVEVSIFYDREHWQLQESSVYSVLPWKPFGIMSGL